MLDQIVAKTNFIFSADSYHNDSMKAQERVRRGFSRAITVDDPATRKPSDFKLFLTYHGNKTQIFHLLVRLWGSKAAALRLEKCGTAAAVVDGNAYKLESAESNVNVSKSLGITVGLPGQIPCMSKFSHHSLSTMILWKENCEIYGALVTGNKAVTTKL